MLKEQETSLSEARQQCVGLEGQLDRARDEAERLQANVQMYKHKYETTNSQATHLESTVSSMQEKLQDARARVSQSLFSPCFLSINNDN